MKPPPKVSHTPLTPFLHIYAKKVRYTPLTALTANTT